MNDMIELPVLPEGAAEALANGTLRDPFGVLGPRDTGMGRVVRAYLPGALEVEALTRTGGASLGRLAPVAPHGLFVGRLDSVEPYLLRITWPGAVQ
jgi:1,4-alpha-glucan branching enzyme